MFSHIHLLITIALAGIRSPSLVLAARNIKTIAIRQHHLLRLIVDIALGHLVLLAVALVRIARDARLVRVLALHAIRIHVAISAAIHKIRR